jgi:hypothetical protein
MYLPEADLKLTLRTRRPLPPLRFAVVDEPSSASFPLNRTCPRVPGIGVPPYKRIPGLGRWTRRLNDRVRAVVLPLIRRRRNATVAVVGDRAPAPVWGGTTIIHEQRLGNLSAVVGREIDLGTPTHRSRTRRTNRIRAGQTISSREVRYLRHPEVRDNGPAPGIRRWSVCSDYLTKGE